MWIYTHILIKESQQHMGTFFLLNRFYLVLINNVLSINLSKSGPTMQIGGPSGGTGSIFFFTFGELKKKTHESSHTIFSCYKSVCS